MGWNVNIVPIAGLEVRCGERCDYRSGDVSLDEAEELQSAHYAIHVRANALNDTYVKVGVPCPFCLNIREDGHECSPWDGVDHTQVEP